MISVERITQLFSDCFYTEWRTRLHGGASEPYYSPSVGLDQPHVIWFTQDYIASALHEIAHWCVAGPARLLLPDYGYWYAPDGRTVDQQQAFELVERKPQALEWIFSRACGLPFRVSADNLQAGLGASDQFKQGIANTARMYCLTLPERPTCFVEALQKHCKTTDILNAAHYCASKLA